MTQLQALVPPPRLPPPEIDWSGLRRRLAVELPEDFRALITAYGTGAFDGFIWLLQPMGSNEHLDLSRQMQVRLDALRSVEAWGEKVPFRLTPGQENLIPWAITDNGDVFYWVAEPRDRPSRWTVACNEARGPEWDVFDGSATEYLLAILSKARRVGLLPEDFPSDAPRFEALV